MAMMMDMNGGGGNNNGGNNNGGVSNGGGGVYGESGVSGISDIMKWNICLNGFNKMDQLLYQWDINGLHEQMQYNCCVWLVKVSGIRAGTSEGEGVGRGACTLVGEDISFTNNNNIKLTLSFPSKNLQLITKTIPIPTNIFNVWNTFILDSIPSNELFSLSSTTINSMIRDKDGFNIIPGTVL